MKRSTMTGATTHRDLAGEMRIERSTARTDRRVHSLLALAILVMALQPVGAQHRVGLSNLGGGFVTSFGTGDGIVFDALRPLRIHELRVFVTNGTAGLVPFDLELRDGASALLTRRAIMVAAGFQTIRLQPPLDVPVGNGHALVIATRPGAAPLSFFGQMDGVNYGPLAIPGLLAMRRAVQGTPDSYPGLYDWVVSGQADADRWELNQPEARMTPLLDFVSGPFDELTDPNAATTTQVSVTTRWNAQLQGGLRRAVLSLESTLAGQGFDLALSSAPILPGRAGALTTTAGQLVHVDLTEPSLAFAFGVGGQPGLPAYPTAFSPVRLPFHRVDTAFTGVLQMIVVDPASLDGFTLSQAIEATFLPCPLVEDFDQTITGAGLASLLLPGWSTLDLTSSFRWRVVDSAVPSTVGGLPLPAFSGPNYLICQPALGLASQTSQLLTCPIEVARLQAREVSFALARPGAGVGTLRVYQIESPGLTRTLLRTWTGQDPAGSPMAPVWSVETLSLNTTASAVGILFEYAQNGAPDGLIAIDRVVFR